MLTKDTGGWAFPQPTFTHQNGETYGSGDWDSRNGGMTLRDWFAGQALGHLLTIGNGEGTIVWAAIASEAYSMADAMLAERAK